MRRYNVDKIITHAQRSRTADLQRQMLGLQSEIDVLKMERDQMKRKLSVHEKREKGRIDGLKKAQAKRKGTSKK